jgi:hypothetical protein
MHMRKELTVLLVAVVALLLIILLVPESSFKDKGYGEERGASTSTPQYAAETTLSVKLGEEGKALGVAVTPLAVLEDSRCPIDVQCIQAGTVRLSLHVKSAVAEDTLELRIGSSVSSENERLMFIDVEPPRRSGSELPDSEYEFRFNIATLQGGEF